MVSLALLGLPKHWDSYQDSINGQEKLQDWERLWSYLMQDVIRRNTRDGTSSKEVEEDFVLASKEKWAKGKKSQGEEGRNKMNLMKYKCFHSHEHKTIPRTSHRGKQARMSRQ